MSAEFPKPKYAIGDKVWTGYAANAPEKVPCPDCLGSKVWQVSSPAGYSGSTTCPRCDGAGNLSQYSYSPMVRELTIGQIQMTNPPRGGDDIFNYMCTETGVGSGAVHRERSLFLMREEALADAMRATNEAIESLDKNNPRRALWRTLAVYQLRDAEIKEAEENKREAEYKVTQLITRICEMDTYPVAGDRYETRHVSLTEEQVKAVQESLVYLFPWAADVLDSYREDEGQ